MTGPEGDKGSRPVDVAEVERLAEWASQRGPAHLRDEMRDEARLRVLEALSAGCTAGLGRVAYRGAMAALRAGLYQAGARASRTAFELGTARVTFLPPCSSEDDSRHSDQASLVDHEPVATPAGFGPVLDELVDRLADRGVDRDAVVAALWVLVDAADQSARVRPGRFAPGVQVRTRTMTTPAGLMAEKSGLSHRQCVALKTLVLGRGPRLERHAEPVDGLLARGRRGEHVWADPRVSYLMGEVVSPSGRLQHAWMSDASASDTQRVDVIA